MNDLAEEAICDQLTETTLGALSEYITSGSRDWSKYYADSGAVFIRTQDINQNRLSLSNVAHVQLPSKVEGKRSLVRKGDLLITITGANVGKVAVVEQELPEAYVSQSVALVRLRDPGLAKFAQLQLIAKRGDKSTLEAMAYGLGRPVLNLENIRSAPIKIAPIDVRSEIVAEIEKQFSRLDEAIANLKRSKHGLARFQDSVLNKAVADWPTTELHALLREPLRNGHSAKATNDQNGLRAFTLTAVTEGDFSEVNTKRTAAEPRKVADLWAQPGDIYIERSNTPELVGTARLYKGLPNFAFIPDLLIRVRVNSRILPEYAEIALRSDLARRYFRSRAQGIAGSMPKIDQETVESFQVPLPPPAEQHRIVADVERRMSVVREVGAEVDANLARARVLRQAVLASLFVNPPAER